MKKLWAFRVKYPRAAKWYDGDWCNLSNWCDIEFGKGKWEYFNPYFLFDDEKHKLLFLLRWSS